MEFIHLHNHSEYSLLDGMLRISENHKPSRFLKALAESGAKALAITDHGNMFGAIDFYTSARAAGIKPILGCETYITTGDHKSKERTDKVGHLTLLVKDYEGYKNLMKLVSAAYVDGFYYHPRIDKELLARYSKGLIALSGCLKGFVPQAALHQSFEKACGIAKEFEDIMGKGNYYIELMDHGIREEQEVLPILKDISKMTGIPLVATNDCHYEKKDDWEAHDINLCIGTGKTLNDPQRMKMSTHELYFKSPEEMHALFAHTPQSLKNTLVIAEQCNIEMPHNGFILPEFKIPAEYTDTNDYFSQLCNQKLKEKLGGAIAHEYQERLDYELSVINSMGFASYFLIVADFIQWAKSNDIPVGPGRGSGAGSIVAYSLGITLVDPLPHKLLFERFLNPDRVTMPDLDIDFSDSGRERVIEYVRNKYGAANVAQIITFGTMKAKLAVRDVARVLGISVAETNRLAKLIPNDLGTTLDDAVNNVRELQTEINNNPQTKRLFDLARKIEGLKRHTGIHAAGVLITKEAVSNYTPLARGSRDAITTQYEGEPLVSLGLLKVDFLGLRTLTVIDNAEKMIRNLRGIEFDINKIPLDDKKTYELLAAARTLGIFQLESGGMRDLVKRLAPSRFSDISALVALYRPGPMESGMMDMFVRRKSGQEKIEYETPLLEPILNETYGTMVYQEQIMEASKKLGGFTPGQADSLRKAMGKKRIEDMEKARIRFYEGCEKNKISKKTAEKIYDQMIKFAGYGFNKSHSVAYALLSYQTAYLKANYPIEFMCAALTNEIGHNAIGSDDKENKIATYLEEAKQMGFEILPPDINHSKPYFAVEKVGEKECIRYALEAIKNAGTEGCEIIAREVKKGPYKSLEDLCSRIDLYQSNKKTIESFAKSGALDCLVPDKKDPKEARAEILACIDDVVDTANMVAKEKQDNTASLFGDDFTSVMSIKKTERKTVRPLTQSELLNFEKEVLGLYFSGHPLALYQNYLHTLHCTPIIDILEGKASGRLSVLGIITRLKKRQNKKKEEWAQLVIEDCTGSIPVNAFAKAYGNIGHKLTPNAILHFMGDVRVDDESARTEINLQEVSNVTDLIAGAAKEFTIRLPENYTKDHLQKLKHYMDMTKGVTKVYLEVPSKADHSKIHKIRTDKSVLLHRALFEHIENINGASWRFK